MAFEERRRGAASRRVTQHNQHDCWVSLRSTQPTFNYKCLTGHDIIDPRIFEKLGDLNTRNSGARCKLNYSHNQAFIAGSQLTNSSPLNHKLTSV